MEGYLNGSYPINKDRRPRDKQRRSKRSTRRDDVVPNVMGHNLSWSKHQPGLPPHRMVPSGDASYTPYPVHVTYPMEPFQFSLYPTVYPVTSTQPTFCPVPPARKGRKSERYLPPKKPDEKDSGRITSQQYASLPPVQCDPFSGKSTDSDSNSKRHYSDPGVGPASSDESDDSIDGLMSPMYLNLMEEIRDLKEKLRHVTSELSSAKEEIRDIKSKSNCNGVCPDSAYIPGSISDLVSEIRQAAQTREDALLTTIHAKIDALAANHTKEVSALTDRIDLLEQKFAKLESHESKDASVGPEVQEVALAAVAAAVADNSPKVASEKIAESSPPEAFNMIRLLEEQKLKLEEELKEAVDGRSQAVADTQKLQRLVSILRLKINGLSADSRVNDDEPPSTANDLPTQFLHSSEHCSKSLPRQLSHKASNSPPSIPPRPAILASPKRPKASPPARPNEVSAHIPSTVTELEKEEEVRTPRMTEKEEVKTPCKTVNEEVKTPSKTEKEEVKTPSKTKKESVKTPCKIKEEMKTPCKTAVTENNNSPVVKFCIGNVASPPFKFVKQGSEINENGSETLLTPGRTSLGATITVTGPVTDL